MANLITTDTELTSVASAIRAKTGGTDPLEYPAEFISEIGTLTDTSDADATAGDIMSGKSAYVNGVKVNGSYTLAGATSDADAAAGDIMNGKTAYVNGVKVTGNMVPLDTSDANAAAGDVLENKTAYVNGVKITGTLADATGVGF